jgi:nucleoside-diphosphate-sugar epimerase
MRVLIVGGTGFIGRHVARQLRDRGHEVAVLHRGGKPPAESGIVEILGDRRQLLDHASVLRTLAPDVVIDVVLSSAAQARDAVAVFRGAAGRIVALSSMDVYRACGVLQGIEPGPLEPLPLTETSALRTKLQTYPAAQIAMLENVFGWVDRDYDKIPVEQIVLGDRELPGTVLRLPIVYGPGDSLHRLFPLVKRFEDQRRAILFSAEVAEWRASRGYVENVAAAVALAAESGAAAGRVYNVAEPDAPTELEWAKLIAEIAGWHGSFVVLPGEEMPAHLRLPGNTKQHWVAASTRIRDELGYSEPLPRAEAVRRSIEWERRNPPSGFNPYPVDYAAEDRALEGR